MNDLDVFKECYLLFIGKLCLKYNYVQPDSKVIPLYATTKKI